MCTTESFHSTIISPQSIIALTQYNQYEHSLPCIKFIINYNKCTAYHITKIIVNNYGLMYCQNSTITFPLLHAGHPN